MLCSNPFNCSSSQGFRNLNKLPWNKAIKHDLNNLKNNHHRKQQPSLPSASSTTSSCSPHPSMLKTSSLLSTSSSTSASASATIKSVKASAKIRVLSGIDKSKVSAAVAMVVTVAETTRCEAKPLLKPSTQYRTDTPSSSPFPFSSSPSSNLPHL